MIVKAGIYQIGFLMVVEDAELFISGLRALNEKLEKERTMTRYLKDKIVMAILILEKEVALINDRPENSQKSFDYETPLKNIER